MSVDRRRFLGASLAVGALVLSAPHVRAPRPRPGEAFDPGDHGDRPILVLRSPGDEAFALPALAALIRQRRAPAGELALHRAMVGEPGGLTAALQRHHGARLIGIMDDFTHALLEETVRDLGGSVLCRGRHCGLPTGSGASRHVFATSAATRGIGARLGRAMPPGDADFLVQEHCAGGMTADDVTLPPGDPLPWGAALGNAYASMAAGSWRGGPVIAEHRRGGGGAGPGSHRMVSLVADI